jgi:hypothetical protein
MGNTFLRFGLAAIALVACSQRCLAAPHNCWPIDNAAKLSIAEAGSSYPDAPSAAKKRDSGGAPPAMTIGPLHAIDRNYMLVVGTMFAASIVNVEETNKCLQAGTCSFVPEDLRSRKRLYAVGVPAELGVAYLSFMLKDRGHRWWFAPVIAVTAGNIYVAYHAARETGRPGVR